MAENAQHQLKMPLRLHGSAHHTKRHQRPSVRTHHKSWDDCMKRPLAWADLICMAGSHRESHTAILQAYPSPGNDDSGAKSHIVRLDERDHHSVFVRGGEANRSSGLGLAVAEGLGFA